MKASLDTNVLIHLYRAGRQSLIFSRFQDGIYLYEQIYRVELARHGQDVYEMVNEDIRSGKLQVITDDILHELGIRMIFQNHVNENRQLYSPKDLGEIYAISLAQTLGVFSLITDDIKLGGPYMSLLQFVDNQIMPFSFVDVLLLSYLAGEMTADDTLNVFNDINVGSALNWNFRKHLKRFIRRFWTDPYQMSEKIWMQDYCRKYSANAKKLTLRLTERLEERENEANSNVA